MKKLTWKKMLNIKRIIFDDRLRRALTRLNKKAFDDLLPTFAQVIAQQEIPRRSQQPRQRATGAGRKPRLETVEQKLIYILFYFKCYPTFDLAGLLFDIDRSQAHRWMHRLQKALEIALAKKMVLPKRKLTSMEEFIDAFPEVKRVILDGTERLIQRAKDQEKQILDYFRNLKRHTRSHLGAVAPDKRILLLSEAHNGKDHDKGILNQEKWGEYIPEEVKIDGDSGFQGLRECENPSQKNKRRRTNR